MDVRCDLCGHNFSDLVQNFQAHLRDKRIGYILIAIAIVFFLFFGCVVALIVSSNPFLYLLLQQARAGSGCKWMSWMWASSGPHAAIIIKRQTINTDINKAVNRSNLRDINNVAMSTGLSNVGRQQAINNIFHRHKFHLVSTWQGCTYWPLFLF